MLLSCVYTRHKSYTNQPNTKPGNNAPKNISPAEVNLDENSPNIKFHQLKFLISLRIVFGASV